MASRHQPDKAQLLKAEIVRVAVTSDAELMQMLDLSLAQVESGARAITLQELRSRYGR